MNPEDLKKQAEESGDAGVVKPDPGGETLDEVVPMPCGDGCEGCPDCTSDDDTPPETEQPPVDAVQNKDCGHPAVSTCECKTHTEELIPGLKEAKAEAKEEPEVRQAPPEDDPQLQEEILQGLQIELTNTGEVKRHFYGTSQNVTLMLGLAEILQMEVETRQKLQRGFMPSAELTAMSGLARVMQNIGSVLIQVQGTMATMNETMKAGFDEIRQVESAVDAESNQE